MQHHHQNQDNRQGLRRKIKRNYRQQDTQFRQKNKKPKPQPKSK